MGVLGDGSYRYLYAGVFPTGPPFSVALWMGGEGVSASYKDCFCFHHPSDVNRFFRIRSNSDVARSLIRFRGNIKSGIGAGTNLTYSKATPMVGVSFFVCWVSSSATNHKFYWETDAPVTSGANRPLDVTAGGSTRLLATIAGVASWENLLDHVAVYDGALSAQDVLNLNAGRRPDQVRRDILKAYYAIDRRAGLTTIPNLVGTTGHMTVTGTPIWHQGAWRQTVDPGGVMG